MEIVNYENINLREEGSNLSATNQIRVLSTTWYFGTISSKVVKLTHEGFGVPTMPEEFLEAPLISAANVSFSPSVSNIFNRMLL